LVLTVLNEGDSLAGLLASLAQQSQPPQEIIIVDGGSHDDTLALLEATQKNWPHLTIIQEKGANISRGRNLGIARAQNEYIAVTDAGVRLPPTWLEALCAPFETDEQTVLVAGFFHADPDPRRPFEVAMSAAVLPLVDEIQPEKFLPSSRSVAFRKSAWAAVGGYPEWLDYCEDLIFDLRLKALYGAFHFVPQAAVYFKPRTNLRAFYWQYYRYARGDGKADLWRKRHAARYLTYLGLVPALLVLGWLIHPCLWLGLLAGGAVYLRGAYRRLPRWWGALNVIGKLEALMWVVIIRVVGDVAKMLGYPMGWRWRLKNHPPDWRNRVQCKD
jgi:glycosyltransferase involved in cell wall biosynthesis